MKIPAYTKNGPEDPVTNLQGAVNGNIEFGTPQVGPLNMKGYWYDADTPNVADTEFTIDHNLGYIPGGYLVFSMDSAANLYSSRRDEWSTTQVFLKCTQPSVRIRLFVC